jgi:hypothetical protein
MNKRDKIDREIEAIAVIEDEFKALGKLVYTCWKSEQTFKMDSIMANFDKLISKLKEDKK